MLDVSREVRMEDGRIRVTRRDILRGAGAAALVGAVASGQEPGAPAAAKGIARAGPAPSASASRSTARRRRSRSSRA
jgi:hypothetical protein